MIRYSSIKIDSPSFPWRGRRWAFGLFAVPVLGGVAAYFLQPSPLSLGTGAGLMMWAIIAAGCVFYLRGKLKVAKGDLVSKLFDVTFRTTIATASAGWALTLATLFTQVLPADTLCRLVFV